MYSVIISNQAEADKRQIVDYIYTTYGSVDGAAKSLKGLYKCFDALAIAPFKGRIFDIMPDFRIAHAGRYAVIYRVLEEKKLVEIVRIMHEKRDLAAIFR